MLESSWHHGEYGVTKINCDSAIWCLQYDNNKIVSGHEDGTIKVWNKITSTCIKSLIGHTKHVNCLQFENEILVSGSADTTIRIWNIDMGTLLNTITHHTDRVSSIKFLD